MNIRNVLHLVIRKMSVVWMATKWLQIEGLTLTSIGKALAQLTRSHTAGEIIDPPLWKTMVALSTNIGDIHTQRPSNTF